MQRSSNGRRSSTNPVRISMFDREDRSLTRTDSRRTQTLKPKASISSSEASHIPRSRIRTSSCDRTSIKSSFLKAPGKTSLHQYVPATPVTPVTNAVRHSSLSIGSSNRLAAGLPTGRRSLSADRANNIGAKGPRKDTRPLADKTYQAHMLAKIDNYFSVNELSSMLNSSGSLRPITLKMFVEVSAYLVKHLDIKQVLTLTNYLEEVPKIAKKLHYPGSITKSWLKTASALHSWPSVLGWLSWLVKVCEIRELAFESFALENLPFMGTESQVAVSRNAFFSMLSFYQAWNDEKLEEEAALVEKYLEEIESQQGVTMEDLDRASSQLEQEMIKLEAANENSNKIDQEVEQLKEILTSLQNDEAAQLSNISAKEEYMRIVNMEAEQLNSESNVLCEQIRLQSIEQEELIAAIKQQPMTKIERDKILEKCAEIENYMHQFDEHLRDIQEEVYTLDMKLASINNNLNKKVLTYNKEIFMQFSDDIGMNLEELKMPEKGMLQPRIMEELTNKAQLLHNLKEHLRKQLSDQESFIESGTMELEELQEKFRVLQDENNDIADQLKQRKTHINKIKTEAKNEETRLKEQIKNLQNDIGEIQESLPNLQRITAEVEEATDKLDAVRRKKEYIQQNAKDFFKEFYQILGEHRNELNNMLTKVHNIEI